MPNFQLLHEMKLVQDLDLDRTMLKSLENLSAPVLEKAKKLSSNADMAHVMQLLKSSMEDDADVAAST